MKISENIEILKEQIVLERTYRGRPISEYAQEGLSAVLSDTKNYNNNLIECLGCGFITSILLTSEGCPNCGVEDLTLEVKANKEN